MNKPTSELDLLRSKMNAETAQITWQALQRFFASGVLIYVAPGLDLIEVAYQMATDNKTQFEQWLQRGQVAMVSDEQARSWLLENARFWAVVVRPWILIQPSIDNPRVLH